MGEMMNEAYYAKMLKAELVEILLREGYSEFANTRKLPLKAVLVDYVVNLIDHRHAEALEMDVPVCERPYQPECPTCKAAIAGAVCHVCGAVVAVEPRGAEDLSRFLAEGVRKHGPTPRGEDGIPGPARVDVAEGDSRESANPVWGKFAAIASVIEAGNRAATSGQRKIAETIASRSPERTVNGKRQFCCHCKVSLATYRTFPFGNGRIHVCDTCWPESSWNTATCDGCRGTFPVSEMTHERIRDMGSSESDYRCRDCGPLNHERITTTTAARRAELGIDDNLQDALAAVTEAANRVAEAASQSAPKGPITVRELGHRIAEHPLDNLLDLDQELLARIVKRAKYDALREVLRAVDDRVARGVALFPDLRGTAWLAADDIRNMINEAARANGVTEPWRSS